VPDYSFFSPFKPISVEYYGHRNNGTDNALTRLAITLVEYKNMNKQSGFTLVEIAIVLVIIGLLLGGVLKGQELINSAKIKNLSNDLNGVTAAVYAYQDRYKALPGDDLDATTKARWNNLGGGDGNGTVNTGTTVAKFNSSTAADETIRFWQHLRMSGLITGDPTSTALPQNAAGGVLGVQDGAGSTAPAQLSGLVVCTSNLEGKIAGAIDAQQDNGKPDSGFILGFLQTGSVSPGSSEPTRGAAQATAYDEADTSKLYTICKRL
jgi:prepilin-type N-terminal cleavage/methylation domain-containing protein